jgi:hypothetical protein
VLERFCAIYAELVGRSKWYEAREAFRYAVMPLVLAEGTPGEVAARLHARVKDLRAGTSWYSGLRGTVGVMLAAELTMLDESASSYLRQLERCRPWFASRWRFASEMYRGMAILALWIGARQGNAARDVNEADVDRLERVWRAMKRDHPWLTGSSDWPTCAILSATSERPEQVAQRVEQMFTELRRRGFRRGDRLQSAAQILAMEEVQPQAVGARFESLYSDFKRAGLYMHSGDYSEIALLCLAPDQGVPLVERVRGHRARVGELRPKPSRESSFNLACATATLEALGDGPQARRAAHVALVTQVIALIHAQQAAAAAGASSAAAAG